MSRLSKEKEEKIMSNIVAILFERSPEALFTSDISKLEARDEEFVKRLLHNLKNKGLVVMVDKNSSGIKYQKRQRWRLSSDAYDVYKKHQAKQSITINSELEE